VPGADLIQKVLQQASSKTLPDVLMLDNPDLQQIAATGALAPLNDLGLNGDGVAKGVVDASTYQGKLYGLQPVTNTIGLFYNKDMLAKAGVQPPKTWDELKTAAKKLTKGGRYGIAFNAPRLRGHLAVPAVHVDQRRRRDRHRPDPQDRAGPAAVGGPGEDGSASKSVLNWTQADVNDQFKAGKAAMMVNGPWQFPALDEDTEPHYDVVTIPVNKAGQTRSRRSAARPGRSRRPATRTSSRKAAKVVEVPELGREPAGLGEGRTRPSRPRPRCSTSSSRTCRR
jgi:multiple sugar transport system substrate-binding protein